MRLTFAEVMRPQLEAALAFADKISGTLLEVSDLSHALGPAEHAIIKPNLAAQWQRSGDLSPFNAPDATQGLSHRRGLSTDPEQSQEQEQMESDAIEVHIHLCCTG